MSDLSGFQYRPLEFTKTGALARPEQKDAILELVKQGALTDLVVIAHGWNNDMAEAAALYTALIGNVAPILAGAGTDRQFAVLGVLWPSKKFAEDELSPGLDRSARGGAASASGPELGGDALKERLRQLKGTFDGDDETALNEAIGLVDQLEDSPRAQRQFVDTIRSVLPRSSDTRDDASDSFFRKRGDVILDALKLPMTGATSTTTPTGPAHTGGAAGIGDFFGGIKAGAWRLLNYTTYYQMKERAGVVGEGLNGVLGEIRDAAPGLRIHLVGHSFGARVVTAAAAGARSVSPSSLSLLQGAFSHHGFARQFDGRNDGFFRRVLGDKRIDGPIIVTHTANDKAVGTAYPIASRISGDNRLALGDANDPFGGIGRNGAVKLAASELVAGSLLEAGSGYRFEKGKVHNLLADPFIRDHGDVANPAVANAVAHAILAS